MRSKVPCSRSSLDLDIDYPWCSPQKFHTPPVGIQQERRTSLEKVNNYLSPSLTEARKAEASGSASKKGIAAYLGRMRRNITAPNGWLPYSAFSEFGVV